MRLGVCPICGGRTQQRVVDLWEDVEGEMALIKGIDAEVCVQCGEKLYTDTELRRVEDARRNITSKKLTLVPLK